MLEDFAITVSIFSFDVPNRYSILRVLVSVFFDYPLMKQTIKQFFSGCSHQFNLSITQSSKFMLLHDSISMVQLFRGDAQFHKGLQEWCDFLLCSPDRHE